MADQLRALAGTVLLEYLQKQASSWREQFSRDGRVIWVGNSLSGNFFYFFLI